MTDPSRADSVARRHFLALEIAPDEWALDNVFTGIHAAGLLPEDFDVLARQHGSMVWSPLSNLLLYGGTARVDAARAAGVTIGIGSDWSPTGSKNLLGELKVASLYSQHALAGRFSPRDLVAMATKDAAHILKWDSALGSLEAGKRADLLVISGKGGDPYDALLRAKETEILLVMINGVARYGAPAPMAKLAPDDQTVKVGGETRRLYLKQESGDPDVAAVSLAAATDTLRDALRDIAKLAKKAETADAGGGEKARPRRGRAAGLVARARRDPGPGRRAPPAAALQRAARLHGPGALRGRTGPRVRAALDAPQADPARSPDGRRRRGLPGRDRGAAERPAGDPERPSRAVLSEPQRPSA